MNLYPLFFSPIYIEKIWGSQRLKKIYNRSIPNKKIGESWEISDRPEANSQVINGELSGYNLSQLINSCGEKIIGCNSKNNSYDKFPLLFKILTPGSKLSVQVHPDQVVAELFNDESKTEMWYILDAKPGAKIIYGLKNRDINRQELIESVKKRDLVKYLNYHSVTTGDVIFLQPGMIHALLEGVTVAEIQQNSDTTYRLYDWERKRRELHLDRAKKAIKVKLNPDQKTKVLKWTDEKDNYWHLLSACPEFTSYKILLENSCFLRPKKLNSFIIMFCEKGKVNIKYKNKDYLLETGRTCLLPACLSEVKIKGQAKLLLFKKGSDLQELKKLVTKQGLSPDILSFIPGVNLYD